MCRGCNGMNVSCAWRQRRWWWECCASSASASTHDVVCVPALDGPHQEGDGEGEGEVVQPLQCELRGGQGGRACEACRRTRSRTLRRRCCTHLARIELQLCLFSKAGCLGDGSPLGGLSAASAHCVARVACRQEAGVAREGRAEHAQHVPASMAALGCALVRRVGKASGRLLGSQMKGGGGETARAAAGLRRLPRLSGEEFKKACCQSAAVVQMKQKLVGCVQSGAAAGPCCASCPFLATTGTWLRQTTQCVLHAS